MDELLGIAPRPGQVEGPAQKLRTLLKDENWTVMANVKPIDEVLNTTGRVLHSDGEAITSSGS